MNKKLKLIFLPFLLSLMLFNTSFVFAEGDTKYVFERMWPRIEQPWYFQNLSDVAVAADGSVYVADEKNHRIKQFTAQGDFIREWGAQGRGDGQFIRPTSVAIAPDGSVYVGDIGSIQIQQFSAVGDFIKRWSLIGPASENNTNYPTSIAIAPDSSVYTLDPFNQHIHHFTAQGDFIRTWGSVGTGEGQFNKPSDIAISSSGNIYVSDSNSGFIQQFNLKGDFIRRWGGKGEKNGLFNDANAIAIAPDGSIYVTTLNASNHSHVIQQFTAQGDFIRGWGKGEQFDFLINIAVSPNGNIYTAEFSGNRVQVFNSQGEFVQSWQSKGVEKGFFNMPRGVSVSSGGSVYVVDGGAGYINNFRTQQFNPEGDFISEWGVKGNGYSLNNIIVTTDGSIYITEDYKIHKFTVQGSLSLTWGEFGSANGQYKAIKGIAISPDGSLYVADSENHIIQQITAKGSFVRSWGSEGSHEGLFSFPTGIAIASNGNIYVADSGNSRIQQFNSQGDFIRMWGSKGSGEGQFQRLSNIAIAPNGNIYAVDTDNHRIQEFDYQGKFIQILGEQGSGSGQFSYPEGVAIGTRGEIYVVDTGNNRVQKFVPRNPISIEPEISTVATSLHSYKAIILAGGGEVIADRTNNIWSGTKRVTKKAYSALSYQGFDPHKNIKFLTAGNTNIDLDNNKKFDDYEYASKESLRLAITEWAVDAKDVVIFLANHGGPGVFQINNDDVLSGEELNRWVTELETKISGKITIVIEACDSASFFKILSKPDRYLFSSAKSGEPAVISNNGLTSFSYYFWSEISTGHSLKVAFQDARQAMSKHQNAQKNADGLDKYCLGNCTSTAPPPPDIISVSPNNTTLKGDVSQNFSMIVRHLKPLVNMWALIQRPDDIRINPNQPLNFKKIDLSCKKHEGKVAESICEGHYDKFDLKGKYIISFYVNDISGDISTPETIDINQTQGKAVVPAQYDEQQAIVYLRDVIVSGKHKQAALKQQGDKFVAFAINDAETVFSPAASFDTGLNQLIIPHILVLGENYKATFNYLGGLNFQLQSITPK